MNNAPELFLRLPPDLFCFYSKHFNKDEATLFLAMIWIFLIISDFSVSFKFKFWRKVVLFFGHTLSYNCMIWRDPPIVAWEWSFVTLPLFLTNLLGRMSTLLSSLIKILTFSALLFLFWNFYIFVSLTHVNIAATDLNLHLWYEFYKHCKAQSILFVFILVRVFSTISLMVYLKLFYLFTKYNDICFILIVVRKHPNLAILMPLDLV